MSGALYKAHLIKIAHSYCARNSASVNVGVGGPMRGASHFVAEGHECSKIIDARDGGDRSAPQRFGTRAAELAPTA